MSPPDAAPPRAQVVDLDAVGQHRIELPPRDPQRPIRAVMLGAGLGIALNERAPDWRTLLETLAARDSPALPEGVLADLEATATILAARHRPRIPNGVATPFQERIRDAIDELCAPGVEKCDLTGRLREILQQLDCNLVIDLNYDSTAERLLKVEGIPFYRIVGSQIDVVPPLADGTLVLWKIHGCVEYPSTLVLAPTEYQRSYESNYLGDTLRQVGRRTAVVMTVGVGLHDDDVWHYLLRDARGIELVAVRLTRARATARSPADEVPWLAAMLHHFSSVTVIHKQLPAHGGDHLLDALGAVRLSRPRPGKRRGSRDVRSFDAFRSFDLDYHRACEIGSPDAIRAVVTQYGQTYSNLKHLLLARDGNGMSGRWLPCIGSGRSPVAEREADVARALFETVKHAATLAAEVYRAPTGPDRPAGGLLPYLCCQGVIAYVFELLESLGIAHEPVTRPASADADSITLEHGCYLVGANPFERLTSGPSFNHAHFFFVERSQRIGYPLAGAPPPHPRGDGAPAERPLLTEDQWEAAVQCLYEQLDPCLTIGSRTVRLADVTPLYPWGFGRRSAAHFRATVPGTVSRSWHLVADPAGAGRQICKGGSLREPVSPLFCLGGRGEVQIGEYDDFVESAFYVPSGQPGDAARAR